MHGRRPWRVFLFSLLLLAPLADAANPSPDRTSADSAGAQDITDLGVDPTGQFIAAVVAFDNAKATSGLIPGSSPHRDVYLCDYGPSERPTSGTGCRGVSYNPNVVIPATQAPNAPQRVAATLGDGTARQGIFAVAGPGEYISRWHTTSDVSSWTVRTEDNYQALNVTISPDAAWVVYGTAPTSPTAGGRIDVRHGGNGTNKWWVPIESAETGAVRPTTLEHSRQGSVVAVGTTKGVFFLDPGGGKPTGTLGLLGQAETVHDVALSSDGRYLVAGASNGIFLAELHRVGSKIEPVPNSVFNRNFGNDQVQDVAFSLDGKRFAAAAGSKIHFFRRLDTSAIAEPAGTAYDAGTRVADVAYDEKGQLLVAVAGNRVIAFGPNDSNPIWSFDATQSAMGGLDGPLRRVSVSDDAQRIIVAGKTKTMPYSSTISVSATLNTTAGGSAIVPTQTTSLSLNVRNTGSLADNYSFVVVTPIGWPAASADAIRLDPEESGTVRLNVTAPAGSAPGVYGVQVRVRSQASDDLAARRNQPAGYTAGPSFNLTIPRSVVLKVEAPDDRLPLSQGAEQTIAVTLRNEGNAEGVVNLSVRQELTRGASWDIRFAGGDQVRVPAAGTATVNVIIRAPSDGGSGDRNIITIRAREGDTVEATDQVTAYIDPRFGAELRTNKTTWEFFPGQVQTIRLNVTNTGNTDDVYNLSSAITPASFDSDWRVTTETPQITVARGQTKQVSVTVKAVASDAREATLTLRSQSQNDPARVENTLVLNLATVPRPPTNDKDDREIPGVPPVMALLAIALVAIGATRLGGRR